MIKLYTEIADTPLKRELGLMNRKIMAQNSGMLFTFNYPEYLRFWMHNTYIPLDIGFIDNKGKLLQIEEMHPLSMKTIASNHKCRYALEVNKGWFKKNNVKVGAYIKGLGIKLSQDMPVENPPANPEIPPANPEVQLNKSFKDILTDADIRGEKLTIIYQTKNGIVLPPKDISPPFEFVKDKEGKADAIVKAWDEQTAGWKSFIIDNIIDLEHKNKNLAGEITGK